jgi:IS1 family transposase
VSNVLSVERRAEVAFALVEGCSISTTSRMTGVSRDTIGRLLLKLGEGCKRLHNNLVRGVDAGPIEMDELWTFVHKKERRVSSSEPEEWGDAYVYVAMGRHNKLAIAWAVGKRDQATTDAFMRDVRGRVRGIVNLSSDAFTCYEPAIAASFRGMANHGIVSKNYSRSPRRPDGSRREDHRYEPPRTPFIVKRAGCGSPDLDKVSTSLIERQNWTTRGGLRRMTRLSNGFSHKKAALDAAVALWYFYYNTCRWHETIRCSPAMQAGLTGSIWTMAELVEAALSAEPCEPPDAEPMAASEGPAARQTSTGAWLRAVPSPSPEQGDLFQWAAQRPIKTLPPMGTQLSLFPDG